MKRSWSVLVLLAALVPAIARAQAPPDKPAEKPADKPAEKPGKWSGYMFGDFYYYAANHDKNFEQQNGLWFRRIYLGYDREIASNWAIRVRMEANSKGFNETSDRLNPFLKDAYLKWTKGRHSAFIGLSSSPTWELIETFWDRSLEKTPLDLQRFGDSRDLGVGLKGAFDAEKKLNYQLMVGSGTGTKSETDKDKKFYLALWAKPVKGLTLQAYGDWENRKGQADRYTLQGFAAYEQKSYRAAVQFAQQTRQQGPGKEDLKLEILSAFGFRRLTGKAWIFGRFDRTFDPNPEGPKIPYLPFDPTAKSNLFIVGLDLMPTGAVHLMPNLEIVTYDKVKGTKPDTDVVGRLTFYYTF
jgi:hypothetical protein